MPSKFDSSGRADYVPALCTHRPSLLPIERLSEAIGLAPVVGNDDQSRKVGQTWSFRGSKSRNKVSVGEPAEGSLPSSPALQELPPLAIDCCFGETLFAAIDDMGHGA
jgi:hypothetical protein